MYGQSPQRLPRDANERLLERLKSLEQRLGGVERRGSSATYSGVGVPSHAARHATGGGDDLDPADIGAATQADLNDATGDIGDLQTDVGDLQSDVAALPTSFVTTITGDGTETDFTITHNLGSRDCFVAIRAVASPYGGIQPADYSLGMTTTNALLISFSTAPANADQLSVAVIAA